MAKPAADRSAPAQPSSEEAAAKQPPASERGKEDRLEDAEQKEVTLEVLEKEIEELVGQAESGRADFDATREQVLERIRSYGGDLTPDERTKLDGLKTRAESRVRDMKVKALETRIGSIKAAAGATADGGRYREAQAAILAQLESELAALKKEAAPEGAAEARLRKELADLKAELIARVTKLGGEGASKGDKEIVEMRVNMARIEGELAGAQAEGKAGEASAEPATDRGPSALDALRAQFEEQVRLAEQDPTKIVAANDAVMELVVSARGFSREEQDQLGTLYADARKRLKALQQKPGATTEQPAAAEVKPEPAVTFEEPVVVDAKAVEDYTDLLERGEHQFTSGQAKPEQWKVWLEKQLTDLDPADPRRKLALDKYRVLAEQAMAVDAMSHGLAELAKEPKPEGPPTVAPETAPPTPEAESARPMPSARELMSIAKIRAQLWDNPEALKAAMEQAKYAESKGVLESESTRASLAELVKAASGLEQHKALQGPALERLAKEIGVAPAQLEAALNRQKGALEQRAREEIRKETQAGLKTVVAKGALYVGLGAILNRFLPGWGAITAGVRMVETWRQGSVEERKVQERIAQFEKQLAEGDPRDPKALASEFLRDLAADVASLKRTEIDGLRPAADELADPKVMATAMHRDTIQFLQERYPKLTPEQHRELARGAKALYMMDHANAKLEAKVAEQQPNGFRKLIATLDKVLGSKALRGGETTREKMLTTVVFAAAGAMARELPIIRNVLFAYTGFKAGEMLAQGITRRAGRYEVLKPVSAAALAGETAAITKSGVLDRARAQLLDAEFRKKSPTEYQQLREALERHELELLKKAETATAFVDERTNTMEQKLTEKRTKEQERKLVVNSARIAGAVAGAVLGPMAVEWIAKKFQPEPAAKPTEAPPEAVAPVEPEVDPRMEAVGTRQAGDGWTHIRARQFYALEHPELSGDQIVAKMEAHKQMLAELRTARGYKYAANPRHWDDRAFSLKYIEIAKADAMANGVLAEDGRTTLVSLRGEGVLPIDPLGEQQLAPKGGLQFYATEAKFGYGPTGPVTGTEITTGDVRYLAAGDTAMSEDEVQQWIAEHPAAKVVEVRHAGASGKWATVEVLGAGDEKTTIRVPVGERPPSVSSAGIETASGGLVKQGDVEFLTKYTAYERGQILAQIEHDRGVAEGLERQLNQWRAKYGDRSGFAAFELAVRNRVSEAGVRMQNELDTLAGRKAGEVTAEMTRIGNVSPADVARMELNALDQRLGLRTVVERSAAASGDLGRAAGGT